MRGAPPSRPSVTDDAFAWPDTRGSLAAWSAMDKAGVKQISAVNL
jgi:hypothetical protein